MKDDTKSWLAYADENLTAADILQDQGLYNPCLQNIQQTIEKSLKALLLEKVHTQRKIEENRWEKIENRLDSQFF